jgi:glycosyltransferase involved in cell wall biosynthesis
MSAQVTPEISVIIPTYNRYVALRETLVSLSAQVPAALNFEVVVVDDGSTDATPEIASHSFPFAIRYIAQENQGSAAARNNGMQHSTGNILVFIDDDMTLDSGYLAAIMDKTTVGVVTMGVWQPYESINPTPFSNTMALQLKAQAARAIQDQEVPFTECTSNNLAVYRTDFMRVGTWRDVLGDGPTLWGDVECGYRAWKMGCRFVRVADARLIHRDQHIVDLASATKRAFHVSRIVQPLFALHPEIKEHLLMFHDKSPIAWRQDSPELVLRKLARQSASSYPVMAMMEKAALVLERYTPSSMALRLLYRWIVSGYIYRGYREGLRFSQDGVTA